MTMPGPVHVVDDDDSLRTSLARLISGAGYEVVSYPSAEAFLAVASPLLTGCLLLDLRLPGASGLELQDALAARHCALPIVFLTAHGEVAAGVRAMKQGAVDFLEKPAPPSVLLAAIASALAGNEASTRQRRERATLEARAATLSDRERDVWLRVARGELNKQIAYDLGIVERTVKLHRARAMSKLHASSSAELARIAERLGLLEDA